MSSKIDLAQKTHILGQKIIADEGVAMTKELVTPHFLLEVESVARMVILLCAFLVIAYCVWTLERGFEITDEAYYLLLDMRAGSVKNWNLFHSDYCATDCYQQFSTVSLVTAPHKTRSNDDGGKYRGGES
jgi:hypothetical protein